MKIFRNRPVSGSGEQTPAKIDRRNLVLGVGTAGVAAVAVHALRAPAESAPAAEVSQAVAEVGDGYQLTPHVLRYYETTKV